jgi:hypothetical protein
MRAIRILQQNIKPMLTLVHLNRLEALLWAVSSLIRGNKLSLTAIGRAKRIPPVERERSGSGCQRSLEPIRG